MKLLTSISLAVLYLFCATDLSEMTKLPELHEHYQLHKEEKGDMGFLEFLGMHYMGEAHEGDHDHHLPFHDDVDQIIVHIPAITSTNIEPEGKTVIISHSSSWPQVKDFLPSELSFEIWNPPRV